MPAAVAFWSGWTALRMLVEVIAVGSRKASPIDLARRLSQLTQAALVEVEVLESDSDTRTYRIAVESSPHIDYHKLESALLDLGLAVHEIKRVAVKTTH